jgi:transcriptional regulator with XRE-family HTH domain
VLFSYEMKLVDILNQWFKEHSQTEFAAAAGVKQSTVSRWKNAQVPPDFENCLRIAKALGKDPLIIFRAADRPKFAELYEHFFPDYQPKPAPAEASACPEENPDHKIYHEMLETVLHGDDLKCIHAVVAVLEAASGDDAPASAGDSDLKRKHGPYPAVSKPVRKHG